MAFEIWLWYVTVAMVAILSPGPAVLLAVNNSVIYDMKAVAFSTLGNVLGLFTLSAAAMLGLGVVLKTSALLFMAFKIVGALYLIYIGVKQFRNLSNVFDKISLQHKKSKSEYFAIFRKGYLVCVTNPKPIIFFTALFPLFIDATAPLLPQFFILTFTFMGLSYTTLIGYALFAKRLKGWFSTHSRAQWYNRLSGAFFVLLGLSLLGMERK